MKVTKIIVAIMAAGVMMSSCGMLGGNTGATSSNSSNNSAAIASSLGSAVTNYATSSDKKTALAQTGTDVLNYLLSSLLGNSTASTQTIIGTWTYNAPEVRFESENILSQIGGTMASSKIQTTLGTQLEKIGLKAGKTTFQFKEDGSLIVNMNGKKTTGTYKYDSKKQTVTMTGTLGLTTINATVAIQNNMLYLLFDSSKLLSMATTLSSNSSSLASLSALLGNYSGMKLGWSMKK